MRKTVLMLTLALTALAPLAAAQQTPPPAPAGQGQTGGQQRQMTPEMKARMAQMQPILDLAQDVRLLPELEKNPATAMTRAQAKALLPILTKLQAAQAVTPTDAKTYLSQIEDKILSDKQLTALDDLQLKAEKERAARRAQGQKNGQGGQRVPGMGLPGMPPMGGQGGQRGGQGQAGQGQNQNGQNRPGQGGPGQMEPGKFNPFKMGRSADALKGYVAVLQKK